jgi:hypothetical protein
MGWTYKGRDASMQTLPGYGDCDPPDDEPVAGVDYGECSWCPWLPVRNKDGKITGFHPPNTIGWEDAVICDGEDGRPEHFDSCVDGIHEWALWACKDCHEAGYTEWHPNEQPDEDDDLTNE